jgi:hypothetical protein
VSVFWIEPLTVSAIEGTMTIPTPVLAYKPPDYLQGGHNVREVVLSDWIKELCHSLVASGFLQPIGGVDYGDYGEQLWGFQRMAAWRYGLSQKLAVPDKIPILLYPSTITVTQRRIVTATENLQRQDLTEQQTFRLCAELMQLNPDWKRQDLAAHLSKSASWVTQTLAPLDVVEKVREAFLAGSIGKTLVYEISKEPPEQQAGLLGQTREDLKRQREERRNGDQPSSTVKACAITIPLGEGVVFHLKGPGLSLDAAIAQAETAVEKLKAARADGHTAKTIQAWLKHKPPKKPRKAKGEPHGALTASGS